MNKLPHSGREKKILPENWMSVDYCPSDPGISVCGEGVQVEKCTLDVFAGRARSQESPPLWVSVPHASREVCLAAFFTEACYGIF